MILREGQRGTNGRLLFMEAAAIKYVGKEWL
jgi:hypothetical protein